MKGKRKAMRASPKVYAYTTPIYRTTQWRGRRDGIGLLKIGYTEKDVRARVREQFPIKLPDVTPFEIVYEEAAITDGGEVFSDKTVHDMLEDVGVYRVRGEWFECTVEELVAVVAEIRRGKRKSDIGRTKTFNMRPEQKRAVEAASQYFQRFESMFENADRGKRPHFMWNAKMRFGKTFATYMLAKKMKWNRVLIPVDISNCRL